MRRIDDEKRSIKHKTREDDRRGGKQALQKPKTVSAILTLRAFRSFSGKVVFCKVVDLFDSVRLRGPFSKIANRFHLMNFFLKVVYF